MKTKQQQFLKVYWVSCISSLQAQAPDNSHPSFESTQAFVRDLEWSPREDRTKKEDITSGLFAEQYSGFKSNLVHLVQLYSQVLNAWLSRSVSFVYWSAIYFCLLIITARNKTCDLFCTYFYTATLFLDMTTVSCVCKTDLLPHSFTEVPSILALMSFLFFLMAERTASKRKPGHRSSFRISLQK